MPDAGSGIIGWILLSILGIIWYRRREGDIMPKFNNWIRVSKENKLHFTKCAVCGKRHGIVYSFRATLKMYGIEGDKATIACIRALARKPPPIPSGYPAP